MKKNTLLLLLISLIMASHSYANLVLGEVAFTLYDDDATNSDFPPVSGDLLETRVASFEGVNDAALVFNGTTGTHGESSAGNPAAQWQNAQTTITFDTSVNTKGYDIKEIRLFSGWADILSTQNYKIFYSLIDDDAFIELSDDAGNSHVVEEQNGGLLLTRTYDSDGEFILTGLDQLRFDFGQSNTLGNGANFFGYQTVYREFDVIGSPSPVPEHSNSALIIGVICLTSLLSSRSFLLRPIISN